MSSAYSESTATPNHALHLTSSALEDSVRLSALFGAASVGELESLGVARVSRETESSELKSIKQTSIMNYTKIERINPDKHHGQDYAPPYGWVILGIEQYREWPGETTFEDKTVYIIAKKADEE